MKLFEDPDELEKQVKILLNSLKLEFTEENPDEDRIHFYFKQTIEETGNKIGVNIILTKETNYRLEVVASVAFSPIHLEALRNSRPNEIQNMIQEINLFYLPRSGELIINLNDDSNYEGAMFAVNNPIYFGELTVGNLDRAMLKSTKMAELIRLLIQKHLNIIPK